MLLADTVYDDYVLWGTLNVDTQPLDLATDPRTADTAAKIYSSQYGCYRFDNSFVSSPSGRFLTEAAKLYAQ